MKERLEDRTTHEESPEERAEVEAATALTRALEALPNAEVDWTPEGIF
jgi:hypothetical protein